MAEIALRPFREEETAALLALLRDTIQRVNARDYSERERAAWSAGAVATPAWRERLAGALTTVAELHGEVVGFIALTHEGEIDLLFIHADHQGCGIASRLLTYAETQARERRLPRLVTHASITARPFFERRGFSTVAAQEVMRHGVVLRNFRMEKALALPT